MTATVSGRRGHGGAGRVAAIVVAAVVVVGLGVGAWLLLAGPDDDPTAAGGDAVVDLGGDVSAVTVVDWPRDDEDRARRAAFVEAPQVVEVTVGGGSAFRGRTDSAILHQRADTVVAVDLQPSTASGDLESATEGIRTILDDLGLVDDEVSAQLDDWAASDADPDPLAVRDLGLRVDGDGVTYRAELQPTPDGVWFGTLEVALPPDDWPTT